MIIGHDPKLWNADESVDKIESEVSWLASAVHSVGAPLWGGDESFYETLGKERAAHVAKWKNDEKLKMLRNNAEKSWKEKDYEKVSHIYSSISADLSALELKRLSYARKKLDMEEK